MGVRSSVAYGSRHTEAAEGDSVPSAAFILGVMRLLTGNLPLELRNACETFCYAYTTTSFGLGAAGADEARHRTHPGSPVNRGGLVARNRMTLSQQSWRDSATSVEDLFLQVLSKGLAASSCISYGPPGFFSSLRDSRR